MARFSSLCCSIVASDWPQNLRRRLEPTLSEPHLTLTAAPSDFASHAKERKKEREWKLEGNMTAVMFPSNIPFPFLLPFLSTFQFFALPLAMEGAPSIALFPRVPPSERALAVVWLLRLLWIVQSHLPPSRPSCSALRRTPVGPNFLPTSPARSNLHGLDQTPRGPSLSPFPLPFSSLCFKKICVPDLWGPISVLAVLICSSLSVLAVPICSSCSCAYVF